MRRHWSLECGIYSVFLSTLRIGDIEAADNNPPKL